MKKYFFLLLGLLIISLKLLIIDIDPPKWDFSFYQPKDELYYVPMAYNLFETGDLWGGSPPSASYSLLTNFFTYLSLETFGDNYLGLRFSSLFFSLLSFVFFFFLLKRCTKSLILQLAAVLFFALNFSFTTASLVVEPTIVRIMTALLSLWLVMRWKEQKKDKSVNLIWQAALVSTLFLFSYPTNAFVVLAAYLALVLMNHSENGKFAFNTGIKKKFIESSYFTIGIIGSLLLFYLVNTLIGVEFFEAGGNAGATHGSKVALDPRELVRNLIKIFRANIFRFNPLLLFLFSLSLFGLFRGGFQKLNKTVFVTLIFLASFVAQTAFVNDYPERKLIMLLPFLILVSVNGLQLLWKNIYRMKKNHLYIILALNCLPLIPLLYWESTFIIKHILLIFTALLGIILILVLTITKTRKKIIPLAIFFLLLLPEFTFFVEHYIVKRPRHYKTASQSLSEYNGSQFIGGASIGFGLYNDIVPVLNPYLFKTDPEMLWQRIESLSKNNRKDYSIGYREQEDEFRKIGFEPLKVLMPAEKTVYHKDWILYEEIEVK